MKKNKQSSFINRVKKIPEQSRGNYLIYFIDNPLTGEIVHQKKRPKKKYKLKINLHDCIVSLKLKITESLLVNQELTDLEFEKELLRTFKNRGKVKPVYSDEDRIHARIKRQLDLNYPDIVYQSNWSDSVNISHFQRKKKDILGTPKSRPDFMIFNPSKEYIGFAFEVKADDHRDSIRRQVAGELKQTFHLKSQLEYLGELSSFGWQTDVIFSFEEFKEKLENYLN